MTLGVYVVLLVALVVVLGLVVRRELRKDELSADAWMWRTLVPGAIFLYVVVRAVQFGLSGAPWWGTALYAGLGIAFGLIALRCGLEWRRKRVQGPDHNVV